MACSLCEPNGWNRKVCCLCGFDTVGGVYISISIRIETDDSQYPYSTTDMCQSCWEEHGIVVALTHNDELTHS